MVDDKDRPEYEPKPRCTVLRDGNNRHYVVEREEIKKPDGKREVSYAVNVWWNRSPYKTFGGKTYREEALVLRQENGRVGADVILLTHGQVYDLIDALNRAVMNP